MTETLGCVVCGRVGQHGHHRKRRSQGGDDSAVNVCRLCVECHGLVHANPELAYAAGLLIHSWDEVVPLEIEKLELFKFQVYSEPLVLDIDKAMERAEELHHDGVAEGDECPTCHRRVPHKKKPTSPVTKVKALRVPLDDVETYDEIEEAAAEHLGCLSKPHWKYWTHQYALVHVLQDPEAKDALAKEEA